MSKEHGVDVPIRVRENLLAVHLSDVVRALTQIKQTLTPFGMPSEFQRTLDDIL